MAEATICALDNLATDTATDLGGVATLTEANSRFAKQLGKRSNKLKDIKAPLKK
jgi:phage I-like protein